MLLVQRGFNSSDVFKPAGIFGCAILAVDVNLKRDIISEAPLTPLQLGPQERNTPSIPGAGPFWGDECG